MVSAGNATIHWYMGPLCLTTTVPEVSTVKGDLKIGVELSLVLPPRRTWKQLMRNTPSSSINEWPATSTTSGR